MIIHLFDNRLLARARQNSLASILPRPSTRWVAALGEGDYAACERDVRGREIDEGGGGEVECLLDLGGGRRGEGVWFGEEGGGEGPGAVGAEFGGLEAGEGEGAGGVGGEEVGVDAGGVGGLGVSSAGEGEKEGS